MWAPASFDETKTRDADNVDRQVIGRPTESICDFAAVRNANASRGSRIEAAVVARLALASWRQSQVDPVLVCAHRRAAVIRSDSSRSAPRHPPFRDPRIARSLPRNLEGSWGSS